MKILFVPSSILNYFENSKYKYLFKILKMTKLIYFFKFKYINFPISGELNHLGEINEINGYENFTILDGVDDIYYSNDLSRYKKIASIENYPSNFGFKKHKTISFKNVKKKIDSFDVIIYSVSANKKYHIFFSTIKNIPIILFDKKDHPEIYTNPEEDIYRGFDKKFFKIMFKQDLPKIRGGGIFPIAPVPCKIHLKKNSFEKKYDFSFIGKFNDRERTDRKELCFLLKENFANTLIIDTQKKENRIELSKVNEILQKTKINLSPSGIVWCSYRHAELVNFGSPILMPKNNCQIVGEEFKDMEDSILYETELINGSYKIKEKKHLLNKLKLLINDENLRNKIYEKYYLKIKKNHTRFARANYIVTTIQKNII